VVVEVAHLTVELLAVQVVRVAALLLTLFIQTPLAVLLLHRVRAMPVVQVNSIQIITAQAVVVVLVLLVEMAFQQQVAVSVEQVLRLIQLGAQQLHLVKM
jgi:hypothetical protein